MISFMKMLLALLFLFCIIVNSKVDKSANEAELAYNSNFQSNGTAVEFVQPHNYPVAAQPNK